MSQLKLKSNSQLCNKTETVKMKKKKLYERTQNVHHTHVT